MSRSCLALRYPRSLEDRTNVDPQHGSITSRRSRRKSVSANVTARGLDRRRAAALRPDAGPAVVAATRPSTGVGQLPTDVARLVEAIARMMARSDHDKEAGISLHKKEDSGSDEI